MSDRSRRHSLYDGSQAAGVVEEEARAPREVENGFKQFDLMLSMIEREIPRHFRLRPSMLIDLDCAAVDGLQESPGAFRQGPIVIKHSKHVPPPWRQVPRLVEELCDYVNDNFAKSAVHLAAYVLWRVNWVHPWVDGNGRTSRTASYLVLCVRLRCLLPGTRVIPELLVANMQEYYDALESADEAWKKGRLDVSAMEDVLRRHLQSQVLDAARANDDRRVSKPALAHRNSGVIVVDTPKRRRWTWSENKIKILGSAATIAGGIGTVVKACS